MRKPTNIERQVKREQNAKERSVTVKFPMPLFARLEASADREGRVLSDVVRRACDNYCTSEERSAGKRQSTRRGPT